MEERWKNGKKIAHKSSKPVGSYVSKTSVYHLPIELKGIPELYMPGLPYKPFRK
jgi:hypothetical protein